MTRTTTLTTNNSLPTRQQLQEFLRSKGINPEQLKYMSSWEQVQLTKEYQRTLKR